VENPERAVGELDLRPADTGANVLLLEPFDQVVWERARNEAGLTRVALSQCCVDLLTGTGREPAEAESLLSWMAENEHAWRARAAAVTLPVRPTPGRFTPIRSRGKLGSAAVSSDRDDRG
jgi:hypothetical protein